MKGIPRGRTCVEEIRAEVIAIVADEAATAVVVAHSELPTAGFEAKSEGARIKPEIASGEFLGRKVRTLRTTNEAPITSSRLEMDLVVRPPGEAVRERLDIQFRGAGIEAREDDLTHVRPPIAI